jgi:formylglycine-generating enzyme required for sulfatase activity
MALIGGSLWFLAGTPTPVATRAGRLSPPAGMVRVPGGPFIMGSNDESAEDDARPARRVVLPEFFIDRTEVTNRAYRVFNKGHEFPSGEADLPVTNVTYDEAEAYSRWCGKRLPTEEEWEKAARGIDGRTFPWGEGWMPDRVAKRARAPRPASPSPPGEGCSSAPSRVQPVGTLPAGASPYGCLDMAGNAWEWVQGHYGGNPHQRILRGGAVGYGEHSCRTYSRAVEGSGST